MKIYFDTIQESYSKTNMMKNNQTEKADDRLGISKESQSYMVELRDNKMANTSSITYDKKHITWEELSEKAGITDVELQQMYMTVMSNNTSPEEFGKMLEEGYQVSDLDVETVVTILDQIKVALTKAGTEVSGFTDTLDQKTLEEVLGNAAYAEALREPLSEKALAYMIQNDLKPTPESLWKARYSVGSYPDQAEQRQGREKPFEHNEEYVESRWQDPLHMQMQQILMNAGLEINEQTKAGAEFLLQHDLPITAEKMDSYLRICCFTEPVPEEVFIEKIQKQVVEGKNPIHVDLSETDTIYEKAIQLQQDVNSISDEAILDTIQQEQPLDLLHLKRNQEKLGQEQDGWQQDREVSEENSLPFLTAKRQMEEIRLSMTIEANMKLLRTNYQIDTTPLQKVVEDLKQLEAQLQSQGIPQTKEITEKVQQLTGMPAEVIGKVVISKIPFTIDALYQEGKTLQIAYDKALKEYETMWTMPRADMGDSIRKAFRNVDEILMGMGKDSSEENRRAVRILGYNRLEISEENLQKALDIDAEIQVLFTKIKPGKVLRLIREGIEPLQMSVQELNQYLDTIDSEFPAQAESYSRFLYRLDQKGDITPEERESYIGIYRLLHQIDKSDGQATGFVLASGAQVTLENLLTGVRSGKRGELDYLLDDEFAGVREKWLGESITEQIRSCRNGMQEMEFLQQLEQPITISNLVSATNVLQNEMDLYKKYMGQSENIRNAEKELFDQMVDAEPLAEAYESFMENVQEELKQLLHQRRPSLVEIREMQSLWKQVGLRTSLAKEDYYQLPIPMGEEITLVNLHLKHQGETARAEISMTMDGYGRIEAVFTEEQGGGLRGTLYAETASQGTTVLLEQAKKDLLEQTEKTTVAEKNLEIRLGERFQPASSKRTEGNGISSRELFQIAKIFIQSIRNNK